MSPSPPDQTALISIVIPFRNAEEFLQEAIDSVLAQTYTNWELLLVDDGSSDRSSEIAREIGRQHSPKVKVLSHPDRRNLGVSASRNLGLREARGDYACFLDADDIFLPQKLEVERRIMEASPEASVVCGAFLYWYGWTGSEKEARRDFKVTLGVEPERLYQPPELLIHNLRAGGRKPGTSSIMLRRAHLRGDFCDESFIGLGDDQVFWARLSLRVPIFVTDECLFKYRQHPDSLCAVAMKGGEDLPAWQRFLSWLETYLTAEKIDDPEIWKALRSCQRSIKYQIRFAPVKLLYRRAVPVRVRYWLRDGLIKLQAFRHGSAS